MDVRTEVNAGLLLITLSMLALAGCKEDRPAKGAGNGNRPPPRGDGGHSHERGKMLLADAGRHHALLTAHLSPKGNELDIFFETTGDEPEPVALPVTSFTAHISKAGEVESKEVMFECAPADERPKGEKPGTCSHFVAKAPWMKPTDNLSVVVILNLEKERFRITWEKFNPKKYAHHEE